MVLPAPTLCLIAWVTNGEVVSISLMYFLKSLSIFLDLCNFSSYKGCWHYGILTSQQGEHLFPVCCMMHRLVEQLVVLLSVVVLSGLVHESVQEWEESHTPHHGSVVVPVWLLDSYQHQLHKKLLLDR